MERALAEWFAELFTDNLKEDSPQSVRVEVIAKKSNKVRESRRCWVKIILRPANPDHDDWETILKTEPECQAFYKGLACMSSKR